MVVVLALSAIVAWSQSEKMGRGVAIGAPLAVWNKLQDKAKIDTALSKEMSAPKFYELEIFVDKAAVEWGFAWWHTSQFKSLKTAIAETEFGKLGNAVVSAGGICWTSNDPLADILAKGWVWKDAEKEDGKEEVIRK